MRGGNRSTERHRGRLEACREAGFFHLSENQEDLDGGPADESCCIVDWHEILADLYEFETWRRALLGLGCLKQFIFMCDYLAFIQTGGNMSPKDFRKIWIAPTKSEVNRGRAIVE